MKSNEVLHDPWGFRKCQEQSAGGEQRGRGRQNVLFFLKFVNCKGVLNFHAILLSKIMYCYP